MRLAPLACTLDRSALVRSVDQGYTTKLMLSASKREPSGRGRSVAGAPHAPTPGYKLGRVKYNEVGERLCDGPEAGGVQVRSGGQEGALSLLRLLTQLII